MKRLHSELIEIESFMEYDISLIMEDETPERSAIDLVPKTETNRMKILCMQLASGDIEKYTTLYENTRLKEVYELMTLSNAINYRFDNGTAPTN